MKNRPLYLFTLFLCLMPVVAWANAGVPMISPTMFPMLVNLIPIVLLEAYILQRYLQIPGKKALTFATVANVVSTIIGIPITWVLLVGVQFATGGGYAYGLGSMLQNFLAVTWQAPWLIPYEPYIGVMISVARLVLYHFCKINYYIS